MTVADKCPMALGLAWKVRRAVIHPQLGVTHQVEDSFVDNAQEQKKPANVSWPAQCWPNFCDSLNFPMGRFHRWQGAGLPFHPEAR